MRRECKEKVLVACSGGPDSMALLDMSKDKYEVYVAHVNYHKRKSANRDENIVRNYCIKNNLEFIKTDYKDNQKSGNFQDKARVFRYEFFSKCVEQYKLSKVLVAHHKDDLIETYLLQQKRKNDVTYFGLNKNVVIKGVRINRPLLGYTKNQLLNYCLKNDIPYGIDESNLTDHYSRNKLRHSVVEKMSLRQKNDLVKEIREKNNIQQKEIKETKKFINKRSRISVDEFKNFKYQTRFLRMFVGYNISKKQINEIINEINDNHRFEILIHNNYLVFEYDYLEVYAKPEDYYFVFNDLKCFKSKYFKLTKSGNSKQGVTINKDDFPIVIRNYKEGDAIAMRYGTKKINRFFIDNKISSKKRKTWPILLNCKNSAILVPEIGCDKYHYSIKHNLYMVEL